MVEAGVEHEPLIRAACFAGAFAALAIGERRAPRRIQSVRRARRWPGNLGLVAIDTLLLRLLLPAAAVGVAAAAEQRGFGLLRTWELSGPLAALLAVVALDLAVYLQHVLLHAVPALWRLHRVHHADLELDVTSGLRFHPLEILLSMLPSAKSSESTVNDIVTCSPDPTSPSGDSGTPLKLTIPVTLTDTGLASAPAANARSVSASTILFICDAPFCGS
jgi:hypothetical protein